MKANFLRLTVSRASIALAGAMITPHAARAQTPAPAPQAERPSTLSDILVTAQRREQLLQNVPISIVAFDTRHLDALNAEQLGDLDRFTPGLTISDSSITQPRFAIRGVQTDDFGIGTEPSVGIFIDGVYSARSGAALVFFDDIARVEVLKGPQGTLFGRNTSAGAISIITNKPEDELHTAATLRLGDYGKVRAAATANLPLAEALALRVNGLINRRRGYLRDAISGEDRERDHNWSGRASLRWHPSEDADIVLAYDHDDTNKDGPAAIGVSRQALSLDPYGPFANDVINGGESRILNALSLTATHRHGALTLSSLTAYKVFRTRHRQDEDGTADPTRYVDTENLEHNQSVYQELRLGLTSGRLDLLAGASYFGERARQTSGVTALTDSVDYVLGKIAAFPIFTILSRVGGLPVFGVPYREDMNNIARNDSYAAYGDATYRLTEALSVTAGLRYTRDVKRFQWENGRFAALGLETIRAPGALYDAIVGAPLFPANASVSVADFYRATVTKDLVFDSGALEGVPFTRRGTFGDVSPRLVLEYRPIPEVNLYASAAHGYKAGGFNSVQINSFFAPEHVWNFETGIKSDLMDRRIRLNLSAFYFRYRDRQSVSLQNVGGAVPQYITSSGDSRAYGVDLELQVLASRDLIVSAEASGIDSIWSKRIERDIDISGQPTGEPAFRSVLSARYRHATHAAGIVSADLSYSHSTRLRTNAADRAADAAIAAFVDLDRLRSIRASRNFVTVKLGWQPAGIGLKLAVWVENLLDDQKPLASRGLTADLLQTPYVRLDRPRFLGVDLSINY